MVDAAIFAFVGLLYYYLNILLIHTVTLAGASGCLPSIGWFDWNHIHNGGNYKSFCQTVISWLLTVHCLQGTLFNFDMKCHLCTGSDSTSGCWWPCLF